MKNPAVIAKRIGKDASILSPSQKDINAPTTAVRALKKFTSKTFFLFNPLCKSIPKSPISCGISWAATANDVIIPRGILTKKVAPIAIPSIKL